MRASSGYSGPDVQIEHLAQSSLVKHKFGVGRLKSTFILFNENVFRQAAVIAVDLMDWWFLSMLESRV